MSDFFSAWKKGKEKVAIKDVLGKVGTIIWSYATCENEELYERCEEIGATTEEKIKQQGQ